MSICCLVCFLFRLRTLINRFSFGLKISLGRSRSRFSGKYVDHSKYTAYWPLHPSLGKISDCQDLWMEEEATLWRVEGLQPTIPLGDGWSQRLSVLEGNLTLLLFIAVYISISFRKDSTLLDVVQFFTVDEKLTGNISNRTIERLRSQVLPWCGIL